MEEMEEMEEMVMIVMEEGVITNHHDRLETEAEIQVAKVPVNEVWAVMGVGKGTVEGRATNRRYVSPTVLETSTTFPISRIATSKSQWSSSATISLLPKMNANAHSVWAQAMVRGHRDSRTGVLILFTFAP